MFIITRFYKQQTQQVINDCDGLHDKEIDCIKA